jgi:hypothetical protein
VPTQETHGRSEPLPLELIHDALNAAVAPDHIRHDGAHHSAKDTIE